MKRLLSIALVLFWISPAFSTAPRFNPRPRVQAMGNAQIAAESRTDAASYNPAALSKMEGIDFQFPLTMEFSYRSADVIDDIEFLRDDNKPDSEKQTRLENLIRTGSQEGNAIRFNLFPHVAWKRFLVGASLDGLATFNATSNLGSNRLASISDNHLDALVPVATGWDFFDGSLEVGATVKAIYGFQPLREPYVSITSIARVSDSARTEPDKDEFLNLKKRGFGIGADIGLRYWLQPVSKYGLNWGEKTDQIIEYLRPAVGITYQDIANTRYFTDDLEDVEQSVSIGFAVHPRIFIFQNTIAIDIRDINQKKDFLLKLHAGFETVIWKLFSVRGGIDEGYLVGGAGVNLWNFFKFEAFTSAYELGRFSRIREARTIGFMISGGF